MTNRNDPTAGLTRKQIRELRAAGTGEQPADAPTTALPLADDAPTPAMGTPVQPGLPRRAPAGSARSGRRIG